MFEQVFYRYTFVYLFVCLSCSFILFKAKHTSQYARTPSHPWIGITLQTWDPFSFYWRKQNNNKYSFYPNSVYHHHTTTTYLPCLTCCWRQNLDFASWDNQQRYKQTGHRKKRWLPKWRQNLDFASWPQCSFFIVWTFSFAKNNIFIQLAVRFWNTD